MDRATIERVVERGPLADHEGMSGAALDIVEHPEEAVRDREQAGLAWWLAPADEALEDGL